MDRLRLLDVEVVGGEVTTRGVETFVRVSLRPCCLQALRDATAALIRERAEREVEETSGGYGEGAL
jgi:hypothetical protein